MQLEDLVQQYSKLSTPELLARITELRKSRMTKKEVSAKPADRPKAKEKKANEIVDLLQNMSDADRAALAAMLTGGKE